MSNRAQRRAMMRAETNKSSKMLSEYSRQKRIVELLKNGITPEDVRKEYERGLEEGYKQAGLGITKACYAGIILALQEKFSFDEDQCFEAIKAVDEKIVWAIGHTELVDEVLQKTGLKLLLDEPLERVVRE